MLPVHNILLQSFEPKQAKNSESAIGLLLISHLCPCYNIARLSTYENAVTDQTADIWKILSESDSTSDTTRRRRPDVGIWKSGDVGYMGI